MKKFRKLTLAAVSVVMAGTMAVSFAACGGGGGGGGGGPTGGGNNEPFDYYGVLKEDGSLNYDTYAERGNVNLNIAIGYSGLLNSTSYLDLTQTITLPDGITYNSKQFKPAWVQMGKDLNITWNDVWDGTGTANNIVSLVTNKKYNNTDIFTTDLSTVVKKTYKQNVLNLAQYLNRMPNFKNFLNENPIVYLSLLQAGMNATTGANQEILVAPYFDGYNDIERYCIVRHDWAKKLLNGSTAGSSDTYASKCANTTSAKAFMGSTDYTVDALKDATGATVKIKKNYTKALEEATNTSKPLGAAYAAIAGGQYDGTSGNIIDIMNKALDGHTATGAQLLDLFRAYIDVAFTKEDGSAAYSASNRANLFIGYDACWDVDDLVAMLRCVKTNESILASTQYGYSGKVGGIAPRDGNAERLSALVSLACQLYGVRGGTSRNEFTYIDNNGNLQDAREDKKFYEAMANMHDLLSEGLIANFSDGSSFVTESGIGTGDNINKGDQYFFVYDYSQTQTLYGFYNQAVQDGLQTPSGYDFSPIITPVSKWNVNGDDQISADEYFRFTESWRSTKTSGLAINAAVANDAKKLEAALEFIDYLYSDDGQIVSTFGPQAHKEVKNIDGEDEEVIAGGFWYDEEATAAEIAAGEYFTYKGVKYHGTAYKDRYTPTVTPDLIRSFQGRSTTLSNGWKIDGGLIKAKLSFTDYARYLIGSTLPLGVKDQSFENQLTSDMGKKGANVVGLALKAGVIKGMTLEIDSNNYWYTCVPTGLPVTDAFQSTLSEDSNHLLFQWLTGTSKGGEKDYLSIMAWIILKGTAGEFAEQEQEITFNGIDDLLTKQIGTSTVAQLAGARRTIYNTGWTTAKSYWTYLSSLNN